MICGCCKEMGCFAHGDIIKFGIISSSTDHYTFHIWNNGSYTKIIESFNVGVELTLEYTFNENSETTIKIEFPESVQATTAGVSFVTTPDGACCFTAHGTIQICS